MTNNEKTGVGAVVVGAFLLGWWLHKPKAGGDVNVHFNPASVQYDVMSGGNAVVPSTYLPTDVTLPPGSYVVDMNLIGG